MSFRSGERALAVAQDRAIISLGGLEKTGKTSLCFTGPHPIFYLNLGDFGYRAGLDWAISKEYLTSKDVEIADHPVMDEIGLVPPMPDKDASTTERKAWLDESERNYKITQKILRDFRTDYLMACEQADKLGGLVCVDPATKLWQLVSGVKLYEAELKRARMWHRSSKADLEPDRRDYGMANTFMEGLLGRPFMYDSVSALFTMRSQNVYSDDGKKQTDTETVGFKFTPAIVEASVQLILKPGGKQVVARLDSVRRDPDRNKRGREVSDPDWDSVIAVIQS